MPQYRNISSRTSPIITRSQSTLLADRNLTMATESTIKHSVVTTVAEVPKFSGEPDTIDLTQYIKRVETLIKNRGLTEENLKIECFKEHIDPVKGTARHVIAFSTLENIAKFEDYVKAFKKHFQTKSDRDPIRAMVKFLRTAPGSNEPMTAYISRLDTQSRDLQAIFEKSDWADTGNPKLISIKNMALVMMLGQVVQANKGVVQERLYKDLKAGTDLSEVDCLLKGYAEMDPACSQYVLAASKTNTTPNQRQSRSQSRGRSSTPQRGRSQSRTRQNVECYNCHKLGHLARECYADDTCSYCKIKGHNDKVCRKQPWCSYHKRKGHRTADCRAKNSSQNQKENFREGQTSVEDPT